MFRATTEFSTQGGLYGKRCRARISIISPFGQGINSKALRHTALDPLETSIGRTTARRWALNGGSIPTRARDKCSELHTFAAPQFLGRSGGVVCNQMLVRNSS